MKRKIFFTIITFLIALTVNAQNDTMYIMKSGVVIGQYSVNNQIDSIIFYKPFITGNTVVDIDGNVYNTVVIGSQTWLKENLKTTKYNDGISIPLVENDTAWINLSTPGYCWYDNNQTIYGNTYGALYNWYTVNTNKLCPLGWHVPTNVEWTTLVDYLGGSDLAGGKLKEVGTTHWQTPNTEASDLYYFTALPGGERSSFGLSHDVGKIGSWWTATLTNSNEPWTFFVSYNSGKVFSGVSDYILGKTVRCVKD